MRNVTAAILVPMMKLTGFRFSKQYRHGDTKFHRAVYKKAGVFAIYVVMQGDVRVRNFGGDYKAAYAFVKAKE